MNMRLGRIGKSESISAATIAMAVSGIFTFETKLLYANGNSTYITLPLSVMASMGLFLVVIAMVEKSGAQNLGELIQRAFGCILSPIIASVLVLHVFYSAYVPLSQFVRAMHGLFFDGVSYSRIVIFTMPPVLICALLGFETIGRTARLIAPVLIGVLIISMAASVSEFEAYRLYPLPGNNAVAITIQVLEEIGSFLPAMMCLLINSDGINGLKTAKRSGIVSALVAASVCFVSQLALGLCYTYKELGELFMPMFRINYLNKFEAHFMRMDKIVHMIWLAGGMISGAFYIHAGARLFSQSLDMHDIRPAISGGITLVSLMIMIDLESKASTMFSSAREFLNEYGFIVLSATLLLTGLISIFRQGNGMEYLKNKKEA